jgi:hypothetical protein
VASEMITYFKYVPHGFVHVGEAAGWVKTEALNGTHHDHYSMLMQAGPNCKLDSKGEPICPPLEAAA